MHSKSQQTEEHLPKLEEWALIGKHKADEEEKMKQVQKLEQIEKMNKFKEGLDEQVKNNARAKQFQKQKEKYYYEYAKRKENQFNQYQANVRKDLVQKRRQMEEQNSRIIEDIFNSRMKQNDGGYLDIGGKSERDRKITEQKIKKEMVQGLEKQLQEKNQLQTKQKIQDYKLGLQHQMNQPRHYNHIERQRYKEFKQNQKTFDNYSKLLMEKKAEQDEFERKIIEQAAERKLQEQRRKKYEQYQKKAQINIDIIDTLQEQVKMHNDKKVAEKRVNPQEASYSFMSNVFRDKPAPYDKQVYSLQLKRQAEEQKMKKKKDPFMSEEEYKFNRNQLNKIVNGRYAYDQYVDRSLGAIGQKKRLHSLMEQYNDDQSSVFVKNKLQNIKGSDHGLQYSFS